MKSYIVLDIETTGISPDFESITEIGGAKIINNEMVATFSELINPNKAIPPKIVALTGITDEMVKGARQVEEVLKDFIDFCGELPILGHNVAFDYSFLKTYAVRSGMKFEKAGLDTMILSRQFLRNQNSYSLSNLIKNLDIRRENAHRGLDDALATHEIYQLIYRRAYNESNLKYFTPKPILYKPKKQSPMTDKQKRFLLSLIRQHNVQIDYEVDGLTKSQASRKIDHILSTYGRKMV